ncbi:hypothetical protein P7C73_g6603, partial [Tremellales sp. Uapishka_1]
MSAYGMITHDIDSGLFEPDWTVDPSVSAMEGIIRRYFHVPDRAPCNIVITLVPWRYDRLEKKEYDVEAEGLRYRLRVALPLGLPHSILSEVATVRWIRQETNIPTPEVLAFNPSADGDNDLRFPWMLLEVIPGHDFGQKWKTISMEKKEDVVKTLAAFQAELYEKPFTSIGSIFDDSTSVVSTHGHLPYTFHVGQIQAKEFLDPTINVPRGPFRNTFYWLNSDLNPGSTDRMGCLGYSMDAEDGEDVKDDAYPILKLDVASMDPFRRVVANTFPRSTPVETTRLLLPDFEPGDVVIDDHGKVLALLDWSYAVVVPVWLSCRVPDMISIRPRYVRPEKTSYPCPPHPDCTEGGCESYWADLHEWEDTVLQAVFLDEMRQIKPGWMRHYEDGAYRRAIIYAIKIYMDRNSEASLLRGEVPLSGTQSAEEVRAEWDSWSMHGESDDDSAVGGSDTEEEGGETGLSDIESTFSEQMDDEDDDDRI